MELNTLVKSMTPPNVPVIEPERVNERSTGMRALYSDGSVVRGRVRRVVSVVVVVAAR